MRQSMEHEGGVGSAKFRCFLMICGLKSISNVFVKMKKAVFE